MTPFLDDFYFLFNGLKQIAFTFNKADEFGAVNKSMAEFCGSAIEELENKNISVILNKKDSQKIKNFNQEIFKSGERKEEKILLEINNQKKNIEVEIIPHKNSDNKVDYLLYLAVDITDKLEKENIYYRNKERYRTLFEQAPLAFIVSDRRTNIIDWNQKAEEIFGWQKEEVLDKNFNLLIPEDCYAEVTEMTEKLFSGLQNYNNNNIDKNIARDGSEIYCEWNNAIIRDQKDNIIEVISIARDITERLKVEEKIKKQNEELEYSKLRTQFFANISHELKTPLNLIFSSLQLLEFYLYNFQSYRDKDKINNYLNSIKNNGFRLLRLVNNLIDITRIEVDAFSLHRGNFDIVKLIREIVKTVKDYLEEKERDFEFVCDISSAVIACDPFNIERVILNLISNAVKFSNRRDKITLTLQSAGEDVLISVKDTGIGIKKENQAIIFDKFRQVDQSFKKKREGSGIGLSLVKSIIEMHGGKIELESVFNSYTIFKIFLPFKTIDQKTVEKESYSPDSLLNKIELEFSDINYI